MRSIALSPCSAIRRKRHCVHRQVSQDARELIRSFRDSTAFSNHSIVSSCCLYLLHSPRADSPLLFSAMAPSLGLILLGLQNLNAFTAGIPSLNSQSNNIAPATPTRTPPGRVHEASADPLLNNQPAFFNASVDDPAWPLPPFWLTAQHSQGETSLWVMTYDMSHTWNSNHYTCLDALYRSFELMIEHRHPNAPAPMTRILLPVPNPSLDGRDLSHCDLEVAISRNPGDGIFHGYTWYEIYKVLGAVRSAYHLSSVGHYAVVMPRMQGKNYRTVSVQRKGTDGVVLHDFLGDFQTTLANVTFKKRGLGF